MGLRMKNFNILGVHWKIQFLGGRSYEKPIQMGDCLKGWFGQFADLRVGGLGKKRSGVFEGGGLIPQCT